MKSINRFIMFSLMMGLLIFSGCKKDDNTNDNNNNNVTKSKPTVVTLDVDNISASTATGHGNITSDGNDPITEAGVCWNTLPGPSLDDQHAKSSSTSTGKFDVNITGLSPSTTYYIKAYAINGHGTSFGEEKTFDSTLK